MICSARRGVFQLLQQLCDPLKKNSAVKLSRPASQAPPNCAVRTALSFASPSLPPSCSPPCPLLLCGLQIPGSVLVSYEYVPACISARVFTVWIVRTCGRADVPREMRRNQRRFEFHSAFFVPVGGSRRISCRLGAMFRRLGAGSLSAVVDMNAGSFREGPEAF